MSHDVADQRMPFIPCWVPCGGLCTLDRAGRHDRYAERRRTNPIGPGELRILQAIADIAAVLHRAAIVENLGTLLSAQKLVTSASLATANDKLTGSG
ncbi:MAG: hypothetical protein U0559_03165 [Anaerolineae bacterium]